MRYIYHSCPCGQIRGIEAEEYALFKGVPFATAKRWEAPVEVTNWNGVFDATVPGMWCIQNDTYPHERVGPDQFYTDEIVEKQVNIYSEDCLNLNIWTKGDMVDAPVLVFIHGGSYETGGGGSPTFNGKAYCKKGIVLVTINYRLNAFSSAVGDGYTGNYGLQDQICALQWIKHNIQAFGGNPNRVTIMGESAGAMSVQNLILSPLAKGLFHGAIMMSGGGILPKAFAIKEPQIAENLWNDIRNRLQAESLKELSNVPADQIFKTWKCISESKKQYAFSTTPVIDGITIPESPLKLAESGKVNAVPAIIGVLSEDMWPTRLYEAAVEWGALMDKAGMPSVYAYYFDRAVPGSDDGAYHGCDLRYAFGTLYTSWRPYEEIDQRISQNMIDYFAGFVKTGIPCSTNLATWNPITQNNLMFMHFGDSDCEMCKVPEEHLLNVQKRHKPFPGM